MMARFISYTTQKRSSYGLHTAGGVTDLASRFGRQWPSLASVIAAGALQELLGKSATFSPDFAAQDITFEIPITRPGKIICVGVNYPDRNAEYRDGQANPPYPSLFVRFPQSFVGHNESLVRPRVSTQLDYEGEIALIIGRAGRHIAEKDALDHVAAITLCDDGSVRDWIRHGKFNVTQGKNFDKSGSMGPWLVPYVGEAQIDGIRLATRINGETRQDDNTSRMIFSFRKLIAYISTFAKLEPNDIIVTGTPTGSGGRLDPPQWLKPGDVVEVEADGIGTLRNTIADEA